MRILYRGRIENGLMVFDPKHREALQQETRRLEGRRFKLKHLPVYVEFANQNTGEMMSMTIPGTTTTLTKDQMTDYLQTNK